MRPVFLLVPAVFLGAGCAADRTQVPESAALSLRVAGMVKTQGIT